MPKAIRLRLEPHQLAAFRNDRPFRALVTGLGGGKTYVGSRWIVFRATAFPKSKHLATGNTYRQIADVMRPAVFETLEEWGLPYDYAAKDDKVVLRAGGEVWFRSLSPGNYNTLRGAEFGSWWGDEVRDASEDAMNVALGRLRCKHVDRVEYLWTTTPRGYDFVWRRHVKANDPECALIQAPSTANRFLPRNYVASTVRAYAGTPELAEQEIGGKFVTVGNLRACRSFSREKHVRKVAFRPGAPVYLSLDFNVGRICGVLGHFDRGVLRIFRAIRAETLAEFAAAVVVAVSARDEGGDVLRPASVYVYGDAVQGSFRSPQTGIVGWDYLIGKLTPPLRTARRWSVENPPIVDRVVNLAAAFENGLVEIDPDADELIDDVEQTQWDEDGKDLAEKDGERTHFFDAIGYLAFSILRLAAPSRPSGGYDYDLSRLERGHADSRNP